MKNYPCIICGGGHNEMDCPERDLKPDCYECRHRDEDYCPIFKKFIGRGFDEAQAYDCGEFSREVE